MSCLALSREPGEVDVDNVYVHYSATVLQFYSGIMSSSRKLGRASGSEWEHDGSSQVHNPSWHLSPGTCLPSLLARLASHKIPS